MIFEILPTLKYFFIELPIDIYRKTHCWLLHRGTRKFSHWGYHYYPDPSWGGIGDNKKNSTSQYTKICTKCGCRWYGDLIDDCGGPL